MSTVKRIVTMREHPEGNDKAGTPNAIQVGHYTVNKGEPLEVELDTSEWRGKQQLRAFEKEPCVRCEEPEEYSKRLEEEKRDKGSAGDGGQPAGSGEPGQPKGGGKSGKGGSGGKSG